MTRIYLIRHAEAEGNLCRRMHGQYDSNLTPLGLLQVKALKKRFESIHVDACYSSDLTRAENTALAVSIPNGLEFRVDPGFREVCIGKWEDVPFGYLNTFHGLKMTQFGRDPVNWVVDGSETHRQYTSRFLQSLEAAALRHQGGTIAVVTHSVIMKNVLHVLFPEVKIPRSANTAVSCLLYENGAYKIEFLCDSSHLDDELRTNAKQKWWQQYGAQGDDMFWYREGAADVEGLCAVASPIVYTVLEDLRPVGLICLSVREDIGYLDYMGLMEEYRGYGLGVQLLGQAISVMRKKGLSCLKMDPGSSAAMHSLSATLGFSVDEQGLLSLKLPVSISPI